MRPGLMLRPHCSGGVHYGDNQPDRSERQAGSGSAARGTDQRVDRVTERDALAKAPEVWKAYP